MRFVRPGTIARLALILVWVIPQPLSAQGVPAKILSRQRLARDGLARAWLVQVDVDRSRDHVTYLTLDDNWLFTQTDLGLVEVLDAATGRPIWTEPVGQPGWPSLPLSANGRFVAVLNGTRLHLLQRDNGRSAVSEMISGVPSAGPTLTTTRVYVPTMRGLIESWSLPLNQATTTKQQRTTQRRQTPWHHHSVGRSPVPLLATPHSICWPTRSGYLYVGERDSRKILYRIELTDEIVAPLAYRQGTIYAATLGGFIYAVNEKSGAIQWNYVTGAAVTSPPIVIGDRLYVSTIRRGMVALDAETGRQQWWAAGVARFVAASPDRIYANDASNRLLILNAKSGTRLGVLSTEGLPIVLANRQTDRIYLGTRSGLICCLHETSLTKPVRHVSKEVEGGAKEAKAAKKPAAGPATKPPARKQGPDKAPKPKKSPEPKKAPAKAPPDENPFG